MICNNNNAHLQFASRFFCILDQNIFQYPNCQTSENILLCFRIYCINFQQHAIKIHVFQSCVEHETDLIMSTEYASAVIVSDVILSPKLHLVLSVGVLSPSVSLTNTITI